MKTCAFIFNFKLACGRPYVVARTVEQYDDIRPLIRKAEELARSGGAELVGVYVLPSMKSAQDHANKLNYWVRPYCEQYGRNSWEVAQWLEVIQ